MDQAALCATSSTGGVVVNAAILVDGKRPTAASVRRVPEMHLILWTSEKQQVICRYAGGGGGASGRWDDHAPPADPWPTPGMGKSGFKLFGGGGDHHDWCGDWSEDWLV